MKFCRRPFEYIIIDGGEGDVYPCSWSSKKMKVGNLVRQDLPEIWNSGEMKLFRESVTDGSFRHCRPDFCPWLQRNELPELKSESDITPVDTPVEIRIACDKTCNLCCPSCRNEVYVPTERQRENMEIIFERVSPFLKYASRFNIGGMGEPFASPFYMKILENFSPEDPDSTIYFETNGVMFDEAHWNRISHLSNYNLCVFVSVDSLYEPSYNYLRKGGDFKKLKRNLKFISNLRKAGNIKRFTTVMVVQDVNFREMPDFVKYSVDKLGVDSVNFLPIINWGTYTEAGMFVKDVLNPAHPYHKEFLRIREHPLMKLPQVMLWSGGSSHERKEFAARI